MCLRHATAHENGCFQKSIKIGHEPDYVSEALKSMQPLIRSRLTWQHVLCRVCDFNQFKPQIYSTLQQKTGMTYAPR